MCSALDLIHDRDSLVAAHHGLTILHTVQYKENYMASIGAERVRLNFNPSQDNVVDKIKTLTSNLIDVCEDLKQLDPRLASLAQTAYEEAAMWAVKAATTQANGKN